MGISSVVIHKALEPTVKQNFTVQWQDNLERWNNFSFHIFRYRAFMRATKEISKRLSAKNWRVVDSQNVEVLTLYKVKW